MTEPPVLRTPGIEDARVAAGLQHRSWVATYGPLLTPEEVGHLALAERVEHWERRLRKPADRFGALVAEQAGRIIGLVEWEIGPEGDPDAGEVHAIHVAADARGRGVGAVLLGAAVESIHSLGAARTILWVVEGNASARRFYERHGWAFDGMTVERPLGGFARFPLVVEVRYVLGPARPADARPGARVAGSTPGREAISMPYVKDSRVDAYIDSLPGWQQDICRRVRDLVHHADPDVTETIKRTVQPYFVLDGNICALLAARDHVNVFLYDGAIVPDPAGIITAGHENTTARTVAVRRGEAINGDALAAMFRQIIANNRAGGWRKLKGRGSTTGS